MNNSENEENENIENENIEVLLKNCHKSVLRRSTQLNCSNCNMCKCDYNSGKCDRCGNATFYSGNREEKRNK